MEKERILIRRFAINDLEKFKELIRDKMNSEMSVYDDQFPTDDINLQNIFNYFMYSDEFYGIVLKPNNIMIGFISLNLIDEKTRNLGYCIHSKYQNLGYGTDAVELIIDYAKNDLKLDKLVSGTAMNNIPSIKLLKKFNFKEVSQSKACFANDKNGNPINFIACSYELIL